MEKEQIIINNKVIETERLILRPFKETDLDDFYEYAKVEGVGEMAGWFHHANKEETKVILDKFLTGGKIFALVYKENNKVIGSLGLEDYERMIPLPEFHNYLGKELGFVLSKDYWGKGLMPEACKAVIKYAFDELDFDFILCGYYTFNNQSKRVQEKLGFKSYKQFISKTKLGDYDTILNLLINPNKSISKDFLLKK